MADEGQLGVARVAAGAFERLDHRAIALDELGIVLVAAKGPARDVLDFVGRARIAAAADGGDGGPLVRMRGRQAPRARAAERQAGEVEAFVVDLVGLLHVVENGEGAVGIRPAGFPVALRLALREDDEEWEDDDDDDDDFDDDDEDDAEEDGEA